MVKKLRKDEESTKHLLLVYYVGTVVFRWYKREIYSISAKIYVDIKL